MDPDVPAERAETVVDAAGCSRSPVPWTPTSTGASTTRFPTTPPTESRASAQGGVTTGLTYMRTGQYYLNRGGPYAEFFPHVLAAPEGRSFVDYGFHLAPMSRQHIDEIPSISTDFGVTSFKIFMFYGSHGLHGRSATRFRSS